MGEGPRRPCIQATLLDGWWRRSSMPTWRNVSPVFSSRGHPTQKRAAPWPVCWSSPYNHPQCGHLGLNLCLQVLLAQHCRFSFDYSGEREYYKLLAPRLLLHQQCKCTPGGGPRLADLPSTAPLARIRSGGVDTTLSSTAVGYPSCRGVDHLTIT